MGELQAKSIATFLELYPDNSITSKILKKKIKPFTTYDFKFTNSLIYTYLNVWGNTIEVMVFSKYS